MSWHMLFQEMETILADTDRLFDICCTYIRRPDQLPKNLSAAFLTKYWSTLRITSTDSPSLVTLVSLSQFPHELRSFGHILQEKLKVIKPVSSQ